MPLPLYHYNLKDYSESTIANSEFKYFKFIVENKKIILSTSNGVEAFDGYKYLDSLTIHLKSNYKLIKTNADRVEDNDYYWDINRSNYKEKSIYIELDKNNTVSNYNNRNEKIVIACLIVAFFVISIIIIFRRKARRTFDF